MFSLLHQRCTRDDFWYAVLCVELRKMLIQRIVVGRIDCLADIVDMGRGLCPRNVASRDMEFHQRATLFREAHPATTTANHGHNVECRWGSVLAYQTKA